MSWRALIGLSIGTVAGLLGGCAQTSRIDESALTTQAQSRKAVAVMRVGAASPSCINVEALLGVREGSGFRRHTPLRVANVRSVTEPAVAEVELEPGEYHVIAYACMTARGHKVLADPAGADIASDGSRLYATSYASFRLEPGEVVNVGYLHVGASHVGRSAFGRPLRIDLDVTDWPLAELERYKARRPELYARMRTRLMTVDLGRSAPSSAADCARLKALRTEGKIQSLPAACA